MECVALCGWSPLPRASLSANFKRVLSLYYDIFLLFINFLWTLWLLLVVLLYGYYSCVMYMCMKYEVYAFIMLIIRLWLWKNYGYMKHRNISALFIGFLCCLTQPERSLENGNVELWRTTGNRTFQINYWRIDLINYRNLLEIRLCLAFVIHFLELLCMYAGSLELSGFGRTLKTLESGRRKFP